MNDLSISELIDKGATIELRFHGERSLRDAYKKIAPFRNLGNIRKGSYNNIQWLRVVSKKIEVTVFYEGGK
ncbi:hypothetical protein J14TS2_44730 [Bacillus sp. J14TS2]|uniref:hypothetical protein n=1 Tax=Bacillus sp. J14TS2 TaxID=2807188 RepID=UPI001B13F871|nr:hypothetical protein [Bacillus sp. J14TS2]GIN73998.1 hypothetical protein J14TS2_44730 [Bacillus sp. J14TS2]